jgi:hypothetical protein
MTRLACLPSSTPYLFADEITAGLFAQSWTEFQIWGAGSIRDQPKHGEPDAPDGSETIRDTCLE